MIHGSIFAHGRSAKGHNHIKNDDRFVVTALDENNLLLGVSDGLGGHPGGDVAAEVVVNCLKSISVNLHSTTSLLKKAINQADIIIRDKVRKNPHFRGMGATATALIIRNGWGYWAHIGDSRLYLLRSKRILKMTNDHSYIEGLIEAGHISVERAENHPMRHVLDQCVGCIVSGVETGCFRIHSGDILLVCSDGLYRTVEESNIIKFLTKSDNMFQVVDRLIDTSLLAADCDDVTVSVAFVA